MPRSRVTTSELVRTFNSASHPIYVLDDELRVVFCNRACLDWLGASAEGLLGCRCVYNSSPEPTGPNAVAAGLCPPPGILAGNPLTATVAHTPNAGEPLRHRRVRFIPLGAGPEELIGIVAIVHTEDVPEPAAETAAPSPPVGQEAAAAQLHEIIRQFRREAASRFRADRLIGDSPAVRRARAQVELAAEARCSVLLVGPPGSGRQHVAASIHYGADPHGSGSLIPLACSVLGAELIRSTVTALTIGSPLGDATDRSTLLLNDVDQLTAEMQTELAGVLVGRTFPLRLIATAERPLGDLVRDGQYREDLAALLSTVTIELPALAERRGDLPLLAQLFLEEANANGPRQIGGFTPEALDLLDTYRWPGNLDELAQVVGEAHRSARGLEIATEDLPEKIRLAASAAAHPRRPEETIILDEFLARIEHELIRRALSQAKGNKAKAARLLGMTRPRLYRRLQQLGLEEEDG